MQRYENLFINGQWVPSRSGRSIDVVNASTEEVMGSIPAGTAEDADAAVLAARAAFAGWAATPAEERRDFLEKLQQGVAGRAEELARTITGEVGMPLKLSQRIQAGLPVAVLESFARLLGEYRFEEQVGNSLVLREPVGVVACITPWNYPLHQIIAKVAPAWRPAARWWSSRAKSPLSTPLCWLKSSSRPVCRRGSSIWSAGRDRWSARRWPGIRRWT
jgi:acyl-CoA reductase-like NAD-dependent aldehyde dehydrogenase